jgi:hypothetical protein
MRYALLGAAALLAAETAAIACSCVDTDDPAELRRYAAETAERAVALVEVEVVTPYNPATGEGEVMRVVRTIAGKAPATFRIPRGNFPSSASCDEDYRAGQRDEVVLYSAPPGAAASMPAYRTSGLCTNHLLDKAEFRNVLIDRLGGNHDSGERG